MSYGTGHAVASAIFVGKDSVSEDAQRSAPPGKMTATVLAVATMDSKGDEISFVAEQIRRAGCTCVLVDVSCKEPPALTADFTREQVTHDSNAECVCFGSWPCAARSGVPARTARTARTLSAAVAQPAAPAMPAAMPAVVQGQPQTSAVR